MRAHGAEYAHRVWQSPMKKRGRGGGKKRKCNERKRETEGRRGRETASTRVSSPIVQPERKLYIPGVSIFIPNVIYVALYSTPIFLSLSLSLSLCLMSSDRFRGSIEIRFRNEEFVTADILRSSYFVIESLFESVKESLRLGISFGVVEIFEGEKGRERERWRNERMGSFSDGLPRR